MRRLVGICLVLLHAVGLTASAAEARLDVGSAGIPHVENAADGPCVPPHDHQTCALCQHLASGAAAAPVAASPAAGCVPGAVAIRVPEEAVPQPFPSPRAIRAPPSA